MKKFLIFLFLIINLFSSNLTKISFAASQTTTYAKAQTGCTLYRSEKMSDSFEDVFFVVPETYFVSVLEVISNDCLKVQYSSFVGFVRASSVVIATFIPNVKSLDGVKCDIKDTSGTQIWSKPTSSSEIYTTIPAKTKGINYISFAYGDIPSGGESNLWYYVTYTPESNSTNVYEGYVYSENVTNLSEIEINPENNPDELSGAKNSGSEIVISSSIRTLLISLIAIPIIILFAIILYKIVKKIGEKRKKMSNFAENENFENAENVELSSESYRPNVLKEQINNLRNASFVRKEKFKTVNKNNYPVFPSYDSDDDLL